MPTAKIVIFIIVLHVDNSYSTYPQVINLLTEFPLIITVMYINTVENLRFIYKNLIYTPLLWISLCIM
ncbi:hypothetical protein SHOMR3_0002 [Staphylococcus hominis]|nr:hypothetical protein SHOMR1_1032 [Staphylococcus hominis]KMU59860.1 hypothetical protein SHOMR3_0002 [Staphylococcus hominis]